MAQLSASQDQGDPSPTRPPRRVANSWTRTRRQGRAAEGDEAAQEQYQDASSGSPKRQARIALIGARDQLRSALRTRSDLKEQIKGSFPDQTIALREAEAQVRDLESQIEDLDTQLALAELVTPVDGTVSSIGMVEGLAAPTSDALVLESASLEVDADVVEADISSLAVGQPALVSIDALDLEVPGTVTSVAPVATAASGSVVTFPVTVSLDEAPEAIRPGMSSDVEITIAEAADVVVVPLTAVTSSPAGDIVRVLGSDGSLEARPVTVGLASETVAEIQSGVTVGDDVVVGTNAERAASAEDGDADEPRGGFAPGGFQGSRAAVDHSSWSPSESSSRDAAPHHRPARRLPRLRHGPHAGAGSRGRGHPGASGRVRGDHGPVGVGQVDAHERHRLPRPADARHLPARRHATSADLEDDEPGRAAQPAHRLRLPVLQPAAAHDARSRTWRTPLHVPGRPARERDAGARARRARAAGPGRPPRPRADRALGRPAAARGHRPRPGQRARRSSSPTSRPATSTARPAPRSWTLFQRAHRAGRTIVLITHEADVAAAARRAPGRTSATGGSRHEASHAT